MNDSVSVRLAVPDDALAIAQIQRTAMLEAIEAGLERAPSAEVSAQLEVGGLASAWLAAIKAAPKGHYLLVARRGAALEAFASVSPAEPVILDGDPADGTDPETGAPRVAYEITNFLVPRANQGQGHEARLMAAITDTVEATELHIWAIAGHDPLTHVLTSTGFAPRPLRRVAKIDGGEVTEHLWWTTLEPKSTAPKPAAN